MTTLSEAVSIPDRSTKPRDRGITLVIDQGLGPDATRDLIDVAGAYVDVVKLGYGTSRLYPTDVLEEKVQLLVDDGIDVCPGGTFFEIAAMQDRVDGYLDACEAVGYTCVEVSDGVRPIDPKVKQDHIRAAVDRGFKVTSEVGRKDPAEDAKLGVEERADLVAQELDAGSWKVIIEARGSGTLGMFDREGDVREDLADELLDLVDPDDVIFEAPKKQQQIWLIDHVGPDVNVGNVPPDRCLALEALRRGLRGDTALWFHGDD